MTEYILESFLLLSYLQDLKESLRISIEWVGHGTDNLHAIRNIHEKTSIFVLNVTKCYFRIRVIGHSRNTQFQISNDPSNSFGCQNRGTQFQSGDSREFLWCQLRLCEHQTNVRVSIEVYYL